MMKMINKKKRNGLTLVELMVVSALSILVLMFIYQVTSGAMNVFIAVKSNSDTLENKTPAMEILNRYFERRGVSVIFNSNTAIASNLGIPTSSKDLIIENNSLTGTGHKITFYSNLGGFGFVDSNDGTTLKLISCRLNESLPATKTIGSGTSASHCYYIFRGTGSTLPQNMDGDNATYSVSGTSYPGDKKLDFISIPSLSNKSLDTGAKECVDPSFTGSVNLTTTIGISDGKIFDADVAQIIPVSGGVDKIDLQAGDFIFRAPYKVELYIKENTQDKNNKWLYSKLTNIGACSDGFIEEALAPAEKLVVESTTSNTDISSITLPTTITDNWIKLNILYRSEYKKDKPKYFSVSKTFGG